MRKLLLLSCFYVVNSYHIPHSKHNSLNDDTKEEHYEIVHPPSIDESYEIPWNAESNSNLQEKHTSKWVDDYFVQEPRPSELITLPGGCEIPVTLYKKVQDFRREAHYVERCYCHDGGIYCKLKKSDDHVKIT